LILDYKLTNKVVSFYSAMDLVNVAEQHRPQLDRYASLFNNENLPVNKAVLFLNMGKLVEL